MDNLKIWIISLCGATAITAIIKLLLSESNLKKSVDIFCAIFILFYTIIPMNNLFSFNKLDSFENFEIEIKLEDGYNKIITESIQNICEKMSVEIISLEIDSYIDDENYLNINSIFLDIDRDDISEKVKEKIKFESGLEVEVF